MNQKVMEDVENYVKKSKNGVHLGQIRADLGLGRGEAMDAIYYLDQLGRVYMFNLDMASLSRWYHIERLLEDISSANGPKEGVNV